MAERHSLAGSIEVDSSNRTRFTCDVSADAEIRPPSKVPSLTRTNIIKCTCGLGIAIAALDLYSDHVREPLVSLVLFTTILRRAVGHIPETALPGKPGNVALGGQRDTLFRPLRYIRLGDTITFKTPAANFQHPVESTHVVSASNVEVLNGTTFPTLTLITCFPFNYLGAAPNRFVVRAREVVFQAPETHSAP